jgi:hypothetical protein
MRKDTGAKAIKGTGVALYGWQPCWPEALHDSNASARRHTPHELKGATDHQCRAVNFPSDGMKDNGFTRRVAQDYPERPYSSVYYPTFVFDNAMMCFKRSYLKKLLPVLLLINERAVKRRVIDRANETERNSGCESKRRRKKEKGSTSFEKRIGEIKDRMVIGTDR